YEQVFQLEEPIEDHCEQNFSNETRTAKEKDGFVRENLDRGDFAGSVRSRSIPGFVLTADRIPSPGRARFHQSAFAVLRNGGKLEDVSRNSAAGQVFRMASHLSLRVGLAATGCP